MLLFYQFQEAADCLGADCVPRYVDVKEIQELDVEMMLDQSKEVSTCYPYSLVVSS